jgi:Protein of unknown function (DUF3489)
VLSKHEENNMAKFTDTQLIVLSAASARDDGIAVIPPKMNKAAASKVGAGLVARKLMREARPKPGMPIWRQDEDGRSISLVITRAGRDAIGVAEDTTPQAPAPSTVRSERSVTPDVETRLEGPSGAKGSIGGGAASPRPGSKQARVIEMLCEEKGATLNALTGETGWLPHTTRAALTGLRKRGFAIERTREEGSDSIYRIVTAAA